MLEVVSADLARRMVVGWGRTRCGETGQPRGRPAPPAGAAPCPVTRKSARCHLIRPVRSLCQRSWPGPGPHGDQEAGDTGSLRITRRAVMTGSPVPPAAGGPASMTRRRPPSCHSRRPAQVRAVPPGRDNCHRTHPHGCHLDPHRRQLQQRHFPEAATASPATSGRRRRRARDPAPGRGPAVLAASRPDPAPPPDRVKGAARPCGTAYGGP